jgi:hypothetical protein
MHGVLRGTCASVAVVDLTHQVAPQDVRGAAFLLYAAYSYFPIDTVHCVVVDPGVGTSRRAIAVQTPRGCFVAPDNGVLSYILACEPVTAAVSLTNPRYHLSPVSHTFHGRDVFAPVAAHLACGVPLADVGDAVARLATFPVPGISVRSDGALGGLVIHVDRFGNLVTSIGQLRWHGDALTVGSAFPLAVERGGGQRLAPFPAGEARVRIAGRCIEGIRPTYGDAPPGELLALLGSVGHLEIAVTGGSAAEVLGAGVGTEVVLEPNRR